MNANKPFVEKKEMEVPKTLQIQFVKTIQLMKTSCNKVIFH